MLLGAARYAVVSQACLKAAQEEHLGMEQKDFERWRQLQKQYQQQYGK